MALHSPTPSDSCSSPLSLASRSPSPPDAYPSPSSSQELGGATTPSRTSHLSSPAPEPDGPPPAKKRKTAEPKARTTSYLDLRPHSGRHEGHQDGLDGVDLQRPQLEALLNVLRTRRKIVVVAGAGISVSAGIPDFRSSTGLFRTLRHQHPIKASGKHLFDASVYKTDASTSSFHDMVRSMSDLVSSADPTPFHHLLASLAQQGRLLRLYSQNVDGIDTSMPPLATQIPLSPRGPWPRTIQLHGGLGKMVCQKCRHLSDFDPALFEGPEPPSCRECEQLDSVRTNIAGKRSHGIGKLRPRIVLYNEYNPDEEAIGAVSSADLRSRPDAIIVVGTSLKVPGVRRIVREMCGVVRGRRNGMAIWINNGPEPLGREFEKCWDLVVRGDADQVAHLAQMGRWDDPDDEPGPFRETTEQDEARLKAGDRVQVIIDKPMKAVKASLTQTMLTPMASPQLKSTKPAPSKKASVPKNAKLGERKSSSKRGPSKAKVGADAKASRITKSFKVKKSVEIDKDAVERGLSMPLAKPSSDSGQMAPLSAASNPSPQPTATPIKAEVAGCSSPLSAPSEEGAHARRADTVSPKGPLPPSLKFLVDT